MDDTVTYYEEAEELARDLQQHEQAASLHDEFQWHGNVTSRARSLVGGAGSLAQRFDLVLPPMRNLIAIGIVISLLTVGAITVSRYEANATVAETPDPAATAAQNVLTNAASNETPAQTLNLTPKFEDPLVAFKSISDQRRLDYQLRLGVDSSKASVDAFVVLVDSPERYPVTGSQCTLDVSGLNQTHQCVAVLDKDLPAGKYALEIDVSHSGQLQETIRTKRFKLQ